MTNNEEIQWHLVELTPISMVGDRRWYQSKCEGESNRVYTNLGVPQGSVSWDRSCSLCTSMICSAIFWGSRRGWWGPTEGHTWRIATPFLRWRLANIHASEHRSAWICRCSNGVFEWALEMLLLNYSMPSKNRGNDTRLQGFYRPRDSSRFISHCCGWHFHSLCWFSWKSGCCDWLAQNLLGNPG